MMEPPPVTTTFTVVAPTHDPLDHQHLPPIKTTFPTTTGATTDRYKNSMHQESVGRSDLMGEMSPPAMLLMNAPPGGGSSGGSLSTRPSAQQGHLQQGITMNVVSRRQPPPSGHQHLHKNHFSSTQMNNSTTSSTKAGTKYYRDQTQHFIAVAEAVKNPNYLQRQRNLHNMQQEELSMISSLAAGSSAVPGGAAGGGGAPLPNYKRYPRSFEAALSGDASGGNDANYVRGAGAKGGPTKKGKKVKHIPVVSAAHDAQVDRLTQEIEDFLEARADGRASLPSGD
ncbi:unnamed protein product [Amoebophrya sp. A25]|nr:unnamed protein product [Amoebophrya sp. A25]|eukprot:GSA25T00009625001.1